LNQEVSSVIRVKEGLTFTSFESLKRLLGEICDEIARKYGILTWDGKPRRAFVLDALLKYSCRGCIRKVLQHPEADNVADALYIQNHRLAVGLLVEGLQSAFRANGFSLGIGQEVNGAFGRPDVVIKPSGACVLVEAGDHEVVVEVKTGQNFAITQIIKYLLDRPHAVGVIWRVLKDQVLIIDPSKHRSLLELCLMAAIMRGADVLTSEPECEHNPIQNLKSKEVGDAQRILDSYLVALQKSLPKVVGSILEIVQNSSRNNAG